MCGIIGYTGTKEASEIMLDALELLEYRGYDSAGIALSDENGGPARIVKRAGRVKDLRLLCEEKNVSGHCGIGHTRWATHGGVSDENAHPHGYGKITIIHNGIIENYRQLIEKYELDGKLKSQTDSEVVAAVLSHFYQGDPYSAIRKTVLKLKGTFALAIMFEDIPGKIYAVRNVSPIVAANTEDGAILSSDVAAIVPFTTQYFVVPELNVVCLSREGIEMYDLSGDKARIDWLTVDWDISRSDKGGYPFYMEKEIMEQPDVINDTVLPRIKDGKPDFTAEGIKDEMLASCERICVIACGTAMHAGLVGKSLIQSMIGIHVDVVMASEFMYNDPVVNDKTLVIAISQSGETIDTLEALKFARKCGSPSISIVNVKGASIARASEHVIYTCAGPEIAVASTKAYTTQLAVLYLLTARMAIARGLWSEDQTKKYMDELLRVPDVMKEVLSQKEEIHHIADTILNAKDVFMIGRGLDYSILLEGSLKLKEVSYIHSEAYASGELKHGTIALITSETPVIAVVTQDKLKSKELSNIKEVQSRGAKVILLIKGDEVLEQEKIWSRIFRLPVMEDEFMVMPASVVLQLIAYYVSLDKGLDVDKPRNLAKVVTVE
ncbi:MAG: glutamine--fructose-6-phosphate transaminase (isomerizing) [Lachnospiraceae bacterium]|nr:glutamine--fructose-6-phosphate transaminase (isomerizing) [Lachnospiraceae bacterium]MDD7627066.1 glutamine--fructose-6-phosphate transaminase (isomerizing) [Lachnospiraceae bacterium]MDY4118953.1 glutamine--fructose-6-phosphate transaminase (isomerizing) [Lachnospiraceae bacterium]